MQLLIYVALAVAVYGLLFFPRWRKKRNRWRKSRMRLVLYTLFYAYLCAVIYLTLLPFRPSWVIDISVGEYANLIPFRDLKMGYGGALKDIVLNVIMTVPFGIFYPYVFRSGLAVTTAVGFLSSVCIESLQLTEAFFGSSYHAFDMTDIITNTAGAILGYIIYRILFYRKGPKPN